LYPVDRQPLETVPVRHAGHQPADRRRFAAAEQPVGREQGYGIRRRRKRLQTARIGPAAKRPPVVGIPAFGEWREPGPFHATPLDVQVLERHKALQATFVGSHTSSNPALLWLEPPRLQHGGSASIGYYPGGDR